MSLILDALKKAERQHKLGEVPGIGAQVPQASSSGWRGLGWVMLFLFAAVMLGLGLYLGGLWSGQSVPMQTGQEQSPPPLLEPVTPAPTAPPPVAAEPLETPPPPAVYEPPPPPPPGPARPLTEMPSGFVSNLPPLSIDIHSYDTQPAKRYVLINMEKYREGDYLAEGPQLIEVLPDGAVLEYLGERFILPIGNQ